MPQEIKEVNIPQEVKHRVVRKTATKRRTMHVESAQETKTAVKQEKTKH